MSMPGRTAEGLLKPSTLRPLGDHRDEGWENDRVVAGVDLGEELDVVGNRSRTSTGGRLGPRVDDLESGGPHKRWQERADIRVLGDRHGERVTGDPSCGRHWLLDDHPATGPHGGGHPIEHS